MAHKEGERKCFSRKRVAGDRVFSRKRGAKNCLCSRKLGAKLKIWGTDSAKAARRFLALKGQGTSPYDGSRFLGAGIPQVIQRP